MILNYRVELCRSCYFKRTRQCPFSDTYIQNLSPVNTLPGGECPHYKPTPWLILDS